MKILSYIFSLLGAAVGFIVCSCSYYQLNPDNNNMSMLPYLSGYAIFRGNPSELNPSPGFELFELNTELFSDYAHKQRLIKVPNGQLLISNGDGLPNFPDGTVLVKTFYYYSDERDFTKGKKIIETRLEIKNDSHWNVGVYLWNDDQTDARLLTSGINRTLNWIDENGNGKVVAYRVPSNRECATCHSSDDEVTPIGPKLRNLNRDVERESHTNQLVFFVNTGILDPVDPASLSSLPKWNDSSRPIQERARAYVEVNCAHCHNLGGYARDSRLLLNYDRTYSDTGIGSLKSEIIKRMEKGEMPGLGNMMVHGEGLELIKAYIESL